jgi:hypothetical protein
MLDAFTICGSLIPMAACQQVQPLPVPGNKWKADLDNSTIPKEDNNNNYNNKTITTVAAKVLNSKLFGMPYQRPRRYSVIYRQSAVTMHDDISSCGAYCLLYYSRFQLWF